MTPMGQTEIVRFALLPPSVNVFSFPITFHPFQLPSCPLVPLPGEFSKQLNGIAAFKIVGFDQRAAVEVAAATYEAIKAGDKRGGSSSTWNEIKFDRQIIAIAKVEGASKIYSDDNDIGRILKDNSKITVVRIGDLPLPLEDVQGQLDFDSLRDSTFQQRARIEAPETSDRLVQETQQ